MRLKWECSKMKLRSSRSNSSKPCERGRLNAITLPNPCRKAICWPVPTIPRGNMWKPLLIRTTSRSRCSMQTILMAQCLCLPLRPPAKAIKMDFKAANLTCLRFRALTILLSIFLIKRSNCMQHLRRPRERLLREIEWSRKRIRRSFGWGCKLMTLPLESSNPIERMTMALSRHERTSSVTSRLLLNDSDLNCSEQNIVWLEKTPTLCKDLTLWALHQSSPRLRKDSWKRFRKK